MSIARFSATATLALVTLSSIPLVPVAALAGPGPKKPGPPTATIARVEAQPFQLTQVLTHPVAGAASHSVYRGETTLTITPVAPAAVKTVPVQVELRTLTTLNTAGDGYTDGWLTLTDPATRQTIQGPLMAVNRTWGELTGIVEGRMAVREGAPQRLRAVFNGLFVQDAAGAYTLVNVESRGVLVDMPGAAKP